MTIKQIQHLLAYHGYYVATVDGIWGGKSEKATLDFQRDFGLMENGTPDEATQKALAHSICYGMPEINYVVDTGSFWDEIEFFNRDEFMCQCFKQPDGPYCDGFPVEPQEKMVRTVNEIRRRLGVPVTIVESGGSGVRCPRHNASKQVGGATNSLHLTGNAADLHSSKPSEEMARVAEEVMGKTGEIGIYSWGIHVGIGKYSRFRG